MTRGMARANDYITRAEAQALIVHTLNQVFSSVAETTKPNQFTVIGAELGQRMHDRAVLHSARVASLTPYQDVNPALESAPTDAEGAES